MGATEEQMQLLENAGITHVAYVLILFSIAFILFLCMLIPLPITRYNGLALILSPSTVVNVLLHIYAVHAWPESADPDNHSRTSTDQDEENLHPGPSRSGRYRQMNGHAHSASEAQRIQDAETFELQGLISDEEDESKAPPYDESRRRESEDQEGAPLFHKDRE